MLHHGPHKTVRGGLGGLSSALAFLFSCEKHDPGLWLTFPAAGALQCPSSAGNRAEHDRISIDKAVGQCMHHCPAKRQCPRWHWQQRHEDAGIPLALNPPQGRESKLPWSREHQEKATLLQSFQIYSYILPPWLNT